MFRQPGLVQVMQMTDRTFVLVSPYDGHITGRFAGLSTTQKMLGYIHQFHLRLVPHPQSVSRAISTRQIDRQHRRSPALLSRAHRPHAVVADEEGLC